MEPIEELNSNGWLTSLPLDIRLGRKLLTLPNTLAYYGMANITVKKGFIVKAHGPEI